MSEQETNTSKEYTMTKLCAICWGKVTEEELIIDPQDNEYLHPECARKKMTEEADG